MFKDFDFLLFLFCLLFFILFIGSSFGIDERLRKLEILHSNYDVCISCGTITERV